MNAEALTATPVAPVAAGSADAAPEPWGETLSRLRGLSAGSFCLRRGWDFAWEREQWQRAAEEGEEHLSVRVGVTEALIGPLWKPDTDSGCAGCAELRERTVLEHALAGDLAHARVPPATPGPLMDELLDAASLLLTERPLKPGELYAVGEVGARRHRVPRSAQCPICGPTSDQLVSPRRREDRLVLHHRPVLSSDPTRGTGGAPLLDRDRVRRRLVDSRFGPVRGILRESRMPFAMSMAVVPDAPAMGHGRARTFPEADPVAVLEAYERLGGFPFDSPVLPEVAYAEVADTALDPFSLGRYTREQLDHPSCRVTPFDADTPLDWVYGHDLRDGRPTLVPAEVGFYQYEYRFRRARRAAREAGPRKRRQFLLESSSGCAVGASPEEAAVHALFEVAERDAFLLAWYRRAPLPHIPPETIEDPVSRALIDLIDAHGFDVHLLVATQDIDLPVVWVLAANRRAPFPATFSSAGSGADPASAVRGALREVAQLVTGPADWDREEVDRMVADPWLVEELEQHVHYYTVPETRDRALACLGGPATSLKEAFPDRPDGLTDAARGDLRGTLDFLRRRFADAGLHEIVLVDQSSREHTDAGMAVTRAVVPGTVPMCFGTAQLRFAGIPRLEAALGAGPPEDERVPYVPHPFP